MITETQIEAALTGLFADITFTEEPSGLYDPLRYMIQIGGKRLRPRLCLTAYSLYKDDFDQSILAPAAGLEVFHSFTLIHDDIMDHSPLRRSKPTVWKKWNEDTAILSGDVMCIDSYRRVCMAPASCLGTVLALFTKTAAQVCEGQQYDMDFESLHSVPMSDYMKMIGLKTAVLIACAAKMGAIIGGASEPDCENLYNYGYSLGLAFQVADDYLDAFGDERVFGKPIGGDIINQKKSWLTVRALEKAEKLSELDADDLAAETGVHCSKAHVLEALSRNVSDDRSRQDKINAVKAIYESLGVNEDAKYEILRLNHEAMDYASKVCSGVRLETLRRFSEKLVGRSR